MNKRLPGCGLIQKHITSKLIVWTKCHVVIAGILAHSGAAGFGMDLSTNMLYEEKPDAWAEYAKVNSKAVKDVKGKCFPYHIRWKRIFGNDQAVGATRTDISDAVNKLFTKSHKDQTDTNGSSVPSNVFNNNIEASANAISSKGSSQDDGKGKGASSNKRKSLTNESLQIQMMMGEWIETAKSAVGDVTEKMKPPPASKPNLPGDDSVKRAKIYSAFSEVCEIGMEELITATHHFAHNREDMDAHRGSCQLRRYDPA